MQAIWKLAATAAAMAPLAGPALADGKEAWRLFVSDHAASQVSVIDALSGAPLATLPLKGPASLFSSASGRTVYAVQGKAGAVTAIGSGIYLDDHGDHGDIEITEPKLTGAEVSGKDPSHLVEHDGVFAAFFDGEGVARIFEEKTAAQGDSAFREVKTAAPQHGVAVPYGAQTVISEPNAAQPDELPVGVRVVDSAGAPVGDVASCPDLHGEASSGNLLAFACKTGLLVVKHGQDAPEITHLAYPASLPEGKTTTLRGGKGLQYFLGNYGPDKIVLIDPTAQADAFRLVRLPARRVHFAVDPVRPNFAYVITEDGALHQIDVLAGTLTKSLPLTKPYSMDGHWSDPRPRIAVAGAQVIVTDPLEGKLHRIDAATFEKGGEIAVAGKPFNIVAVGGSGQTHETE